MDDDMARDGLRGGAAVDDDGDEDDQNDGGKKGKKDNTEDDDKTQEGWFDFRRWFNNNHQSGANQRDEEDYNGHDDYPNSHHYEAAGNGTCVAYDTPSPSSSAFPLPPVQVVIALFVILAFGVGRRR